MKAAVQGAEIFYTSHGQGSVCLVPSSMGTRPFEIQTAELSRHFEVVVVDLRGSGQSTGSFADLTFDLLAEDLDAVRRDVGVERVAVLGHSILGSLAMRQPGRSQQKPPVQAEIPRDSQRRVSCSQRIAADSQRSIDLSQQLTCNSQHIEDLSQRIGCVSQQITRDALRKVRTLLRISGSSQQTSDGPGKS